ncbi:MAG: PAS domain S-box protein [Proteobacteria bacterium]|nr:PAS domain S-box protein [Pseudomonadota bacterium]MBU4011729.1 PAS domain S-box protein [Pseudomonadota bacterium]MBU4034919.1 PAS domain S-box protein [Pseudomonadota bacterium]
MSKQPTYTELEQKLKSSEEHVNALEYKVKSLENELQQRDSFFLFEKDRLETVIESLPGIFYIFHEDGKLFMWNKNLERAIGYSSEEISKMNAIDFFTENNHPQVFEKMQEVFSRGSSSAEWEIESKAGDKFTYFFTAGIYVYRSTKYILGMGCKRTGNVLD